MKKFIVFISIISLGLTTHAQLFTIGKVGIGYLYLGPKAGVNFSTMTVDVGTGQEKEAHFGYQFGAIANLGITDKLSFQPELVYSSKGYVSNATSFDFSTKSNYNYIGLPIIVKYSFLAISGVQIYGAGGIYTDVLTGVKTEFILNGTVEQTIKDSTLSPYNRVDFGFNVGGGANYTFKNGDKLNIDLRFTQGVVNINEQNTTSSSKNMTFQITSIYLFDLTKWVNFKGKSKEKGDAYDKNIPPAEGTKVN